MDPIKQQSSGKKWLQLLAAVPLVLVVGFLLSDILIPKGGSGTVTHLQEVKKQVAPPTFAYCGSDVPRNDKYYKVTLGSADQPEPPNSGGSGTATYLGAGYWLTAHHVAVMCKDAAEIQTEASGNFPVKLIILHNRADVALVKTDILPSVPALYIQKDTKTKHRTTFSVGYPGMQKGYWVSEFRAFLSSKWQEYHHNQTMWDAIWVSPAKRASQLHGVSGAPVLDKNGDIIGVFVSGNRAETKLFSVNTSEVEQLLQCVAESGENAPLMYDMREPLASTLNEENIGIYRETLMQSGTVARLHCLQDLPKKPKK